jgi:hypothetical protein
MKKTKPMEIDTDKVDEAVLALPYLTRHNGCQSLGKGFDWDTLEPAAC